MTHGIHGQDVIPQHEIGHAERMAALETALARRAPGLHPTGAWIGGVSVEDALARGRRVARRIPDDEPGPGAVDA